MDSLDIQMEQFKATQRMQQQQQQLQDHQQQQYLFGRMNSQPSSSSSSFKQVQQPLSLTSTLNKQNYYQQQPLQEQVPLNLNTVPVSLYTNNNNTKNNNAYQYKKMASSTNILSQTLAINEDPYQMKQDNNSKNYGELYKPYSLNEYKNIQKGTNFKLGGLGPNVGNEEWQNKKEQADKRNEFAKNIQSMNTQVIRSQQEQGKIAVNKTTKEISAREKAIEFSKHIPKPTPSGLSFTQSLLQQPPRSQSNAPISRSKNEIEQEILFQKSNSKFESDIEQLEKNHIQFLNQIDRINKQTSKK